MSKKENKTPIFFYYPKQVSEPYYFVMGLENWVLKTYLNLKKSNENLDVHLVNYIPEEGILIFHSGHFPKNIRPTEKQLFVCVQADYSRHRYAQIHVLQNPKGVRNFKFSKKSFFEHRFFSFTEDIFMPHWNQDCIIPRNKDRESVFENLCFFGWPQNLSNELFNKEFEKKLLDEGIQIKIMDSKNWNNYSEADCVIAIRDFKGKSHYNKPFTKIINSYKAGVPVISGYESSALYLKEELGINLPIVNDINDFLDVVVDVKNNYSTYLNSIPRDNVKLKQFQDEEILVKWHQFLKTLQKQYIVWSKSNEFSKRAYFFFREI